MILQTAYSVMTGRAQSYSREAPANAMRLLQEVDELSWSSSRIMQESERGDAPVEFGKGVGCREHLVLQLENVSDEGVHCEGSRISAPCS